MIVGVVQQHFTGNSQDEEGTDKKDNVTLASDWVLSLIFIFGHIFGPMIPSIIVSSTIIFLFLTCPKAHSSQDRYDSSIRIYTCQ